MKYGWILVFTMIIGCGGSSDGGRPVGGLTSGTSSSTSSSTTTGTLGTTGTTASATTSTTGGGASGGGSAGSDALLGETRVGSMHGATYYFEFLNGGRQPPQNPSIFSELSKMGSSWSRIDFNRPHALAAGSDSLRTVARPFVDQALGAGINLVVTLVDWGHPPKTAEEIASWRGWIHQVAEEFQSESRSGRIVWNIWNEPDHESWGSQMALSPSAGIERANEYMVVLKATVDELREVDPNAITLAPTMGWGSTWTRAFYEECKRQGLEQYATYIDVHPDLISQHSGAPFPKQDPEARWGRDRRFSFYGTYSTWGETLADLFELFPSKKITFSEWPFGKNVHPSGRSSLTAEENQAALSLRAYLISLGENVALHLQWEFQEEIVAYQAGDVETPGYFKDVGIRDRSGTNRSVYSVLQSFLTKYHGWQAVAQPDSENPSKIAIVQPGCYRLVIASPDGSERRTITWGVAGNAGGYPEMPRIE